jgi:ABC-type branched-subunit amino acid transport system substrate-binding protein
MICGAQVALVVGCSSPADEKEEAYNIGLLLPYTGSNSGTAANFERAAIYAVGRINDGGGIRGRKIRLVAADTHSNVERALEGVEKLLSEDVLLVIGPESSEIATAIAPVLQEHNVAFLSPLIGAANDKEFDCSHRWFRLAPSARALGEALAKRLSGDGVGTTSILHASGTYNDAFRRAVATRFAALKGTVVDQILLDSNAQSYEETIEAVAASQVESVVLVASPRTAALVVNEFDAVTRAKPAWYLSPLLKTEVLVQNVSSEALDGAIGVAPKIYNNGRDFPEAFAKRWEGDVPLEGAYFYYDAMALVAFGLQIASRDGLDQVSLASLETAILDAAAPPGQASGWDQIESGLKSIKAGATMYYSGLTGPMLLEDCGPRRTGIASAWTIDDGAIKLLAGQ